MTTNTYETDFHAWTVEQAALLRQGRFGEADIPNIIEEIETLGRGEKRILRRLLEGLLTRLLRWQTQDGGRSGCWRAATEIWRLRLHQHLAESPSLRATLHEEIARAWPFALYRAIRKTGFGYASFPRSCPWSTEQVLDSAFYPEE